MEERIFWPREFVGRLNLRDRGVLCVRQSESLAGTIQLNHVTDRSEIGHRHGEGNQLGNKCLANVLLLWRLPGGHNTQRSAGISKRTKKSP